MGNQTNTWTDEFIYEKLTSCQTPFTRHIHTYIYIPGFDSFENFS